MSKRFLVEKEDIVIDKENNILTISGVEVNHIKALRKDVGDKIYVSDYEVIIEKISKDSVFGKIVGNKKNTGVPKTKVTLFLSYLKSDNTEFVVSKAVEIGISEIVPMITKNTVVKLDESTKTKKIDRLSKIIKSSIEQCGRTDDVVIKNIVNICDIKDLKKDYDLVIIAHEKEKTGIKEVFKVLKKSEFDKINSVAIFVGPEGGFDDIELEKIKAKNKDANIKTVSLGERILRAETASIYAMAVVMYEFDT